jgi:hypothetical protein
MGVKSGPRRDHVPDNVVSEKSLPLINPKDLNLFMNSITSKVGIRSLEQILIVSYITR